MNTFLIATSLLVVLISVSILLLSSCAIRGWLTDRIKAFLKFLIDRFTGRNASKFEVHDKFWTWPNIVTLAGVLFVTLYIIQFTNSLWIALIPVTCVLPPLSDCLDGLLADRLNQHSKYGKMLDPLRDRYYTFAVLFNLYWLYGKAVLVPMLLVLAAEGLILGRGALIYWSTGKPAEVHTIGKMRAAIQWVAGYSIVVQAYWLNGAFDFTVVPVIWVMAATSFAALLFYCFRR